ncbi:uncharacterized protein LOC135199291 [Macrobrachium nipponense]|uniref:uncharacterized protein LOC135199291 n=1 Tax=Macrobrachium nipponense TaxID=159736 RepID=UPI0030C7F892
MRDLSLYGSPGSGNEADTESLMECERSPRKSVVVVTKMSGPNARKMTMSNVPLTVAAALASPPNEFMPKIELSSSSRSLNRSIQHLVQEDAENKPSHRPPTPARPSLPTLLPGRVVDVSLNASMASSKSDGRHPAPSRRLTFNSFPRSSSEPRSLTSSPRPNQTPGNDYEDDSDEHSSDVLDSSTRSEGWDHLRGSRGRGPGFTSGSEGHVGFHAPYQPSQYGESGWRGHNGSHGRGGLTSHGENVLSVAKKTLEQLESVLAPTEGHSFSRAIPRTRAPQQIHLET